MNLILNGASVRRSSKIKIFWKQTFFFWLEEHYYHEFLIFEKTIPEENLKIFFLDENGRRWMKMLKNLCRYDSNIFYTIFL